MPSDLVTSNLIEQLDLGQVRLRSGGFQGGGQIGYTHQVVPGSGLVLGVEADAQYVDLHRIRNSTSGYSQQSVVYPTLIFSDNALAHQVDCTDFVGTVRGRVGYGFDRVLVYGTGGFAYGNVTYRGTIADDCRWSGPAGPFKVVVDTYTTRSSRIQTGFVYGGGVEYALPADNFLNFFGASAVTVKAEYLHFDLGSRSVIGELKSTSFAGVFAPAIVAKDRRDGELFRVGLNYRFGIL